MSYKRRLLVIMLAFSVAAFSFANGQQEKSDQESKTVTIWVGGQVAELDDTWTAITQKYEEMTGANIDVQLFGFDVYYDKLLIALSSGSGPDLAFADLGGWVPTFASKGWLLSMEDKISNWEDEGQIWENLWPTVTYQGDRYGLPWYTDARLMLYNKKMFKDAGLDPNNPPKTWDELVKDASIITAQGPRTYGYGVSGTKTEHTTLAYIVFLASNGGQLLSDDYSKAAFNSEAGLETLKFYTDLALKYKVSPEPLSYNEDNYRNLMAQNSVAMAIGGPWSFPLIEAANPDIDYSLSIHPYGKNPASVLGGWALVIPKEAEHPDAAWDFAKYLTSYDTWMYWISEKGGPMPTRKDVAKDSPVLQDEKWQNIFKAFPNAVCRPPIPEYPQVSEQIQLMIQSVLLGEKTPEKAINDAAAKVDEILAGN
ncbi:ABC transporter substrate-binding protein [Sediminispirochaeta smaragdinae]|jgi:multiple sugar transport system substrate-binding protein|uniref:Extracellular solute-binding protein family 1 n=1 Tax=Sediminispirochaeta smaragdinae (strain DSM 11293 / JCM 15392 / SEBR 4228) TaxID=573413 RepID=E1RC64_SEDSS|nr:sugar ABC transporter substrate-binding protein [Sediminispirochaeta smaragdinae]ADK79944.1 extracellular solute-binding protein family 1 [Sediminispirochaeta smaragdinae DSM 11293]